MFSILKRFVNWLCRAAEPITGGAESAIFGAFLTTMLLSFYGLLGSPMLYAGCFAASTIVFIHLIGVPRIAPTTQAPAEGPRFYYYAIGGIVLGLVLLACFMSPDSADEQRVKLARMVFATKTGSAWETSHVDSLSVMYFFPSVYYVVFTAIHALHLIPIFYAIINAVLVVASLLNLWLLFGRERTLKHLFWVTLFIAAPQFLFSGLGGHEEALTLFLVTRAAVWLIVKPLDFRAIFFLLLCSAIAVSVKLTTGIFLPGALLMLLLYFGGKERLVQWFHPRVIGLALVALVPIILLALLPDQLTNANHGITFDGQMKRLAAYHKSHGDMGCAAAHFYLRLFELGIDGIRNYITFLRLHVTSYIPGNGIDLMPSRCVFDSTALIEYFMPFSLTRENSQFGLIPIVAFAALFLARPKSKPLAAACWALFLISTAVYSVKLMFWSGTGRYFMIGVVMLLPAFLITLEAIERYHIRIQRAIAWLLLLPPCFIFITLADHIPQYIFRGDRLTHMAKDVVPKLHQLKEGRVNIYFNDLMSFYTLLRAIPAVDVWAKNELMENATNVIALPKTYSKSINWHNDFWLLPVPSPQGEFTPMGRTYGTFGNVVPSAFYMGMPHHPVKGGAELRRYYPGEAIVPWVKTLGNNYDVQTAARGSETLYFIQDKNTTTGLCLVQSGQAVRWFIDRNFPSCRSYMGF